MVKDKDNLASYNQWSGGQYLNNTTGFEIRMGGILSVSNEYPTIGTTSIKASPDNNNKCSVDTVHVISASDIGKKIIFYFDLYSTNTIILSVYYRLTSNTGQGVVTSTISAPGNMVNHMILTLDEILENTYSVSFRASSNKQQPIYIDNIHINIQ